MKNLTIDAKTHRQLILMGYRLATKGYHFENETQLMQFIVDRVTEVKEGVFVIDYEKETQVAI